MIYINRYCYAFCTGSSLSLPIFFKLSAPCQCHPAP